LKWGGNINIDSFVQKLKKMGKKYLQNINVDNDGVGVNQLQETAG
jgi:hypothetical protein